MLPSFRLIAATFLCGFFVVFAGLRLAASLNDIHEGLPVMSAHAAPVSITPAADREARRGLSSVPVMYDLRFAVSTVAPTLIRVAPTVLDRPGLPLAILPPEDVAKEASLPAAAEPIKEAAQPEAAVAAVEPDGPVTQAPAVVPDAPAEPPTPKAPAIAAIDSQAKPGTAPDWPAAETPAAAAETPAPAAKTAAIEPQAAPLPSTEEPLANPEPDAAAVAEEVPAAPAAALDPEPQPPSLAMAVPKRHAAQAAPRAKAKIVRKKQIRTAHRVAPANPFGNSPRSFGTPGFPQQ